MTLLLALAIGYLIGRITTTVRLRQETRELGQAVWRHEQALRLEQSDWK